MVDVLTPEQRRHNMQSVRQRDTKPEMLIRRGLHTRGFRYRLHQKTLPGRPDLVFPKLHAVVFVNGCFWHGHDCPLFKLPTTRQEFWQKKIEGNRIRDAKAIKSLQQSGWRVLIVWECSLRGRWRRAFADVINDIEVQLNKGQEPLMQFSSNILGSQPN